MAEHIEIRLAVDHDAIGISEVIQSALRESNAKDYSPAVIDRVVANFAPQNVSELMSARLVFVAFIEAKIVGTASLDKDIVRTVFVAPDVQNRGVGRQLMKRVEKVAIENGLSTIFVPSSITAEAFYRGLGFHALRDEFHGEERTIIMQRHLHLAKHGTD